MGKRIFATALLCCAFSCGSALAADQGTEPSAAPPAAAEATIAQGAAPAPAAGVVIPAGTLIIVEITEALSASKAQSGGHFGIRLAEPIMINNAQVVAAGMVGLGDVIDAKPANIGGRPGRLVLAARFLEGGGLRIGLQSFKLGGGGQDNSGLAVGASIALGVVGALIPGGNIEYPAGTRATAKISADVTVASAGPPAAVPPVAPTPVATPSS